MLIIAQVTVLLLIVLSLAPLACSLIDIRNLFLKSYSCFMICLYILLTICGFLHPEIDFDTEMVEVEDDSVKASGTSGSDG